MTPQEWAQCVVVMRSAYTHSFKLDEEGVAVWFEMLADLPGGRVMAAVAHMVKSQKAFPSIADIRSLAENAGPGAADAWEEIMAVVRQVGSYGTPQWSNPKIARGVTFLGGWKDLCATETERLPTLRAQFIRAYEAWDHTEKRDETFAQLGVPGDIPMAEALAHGRRGLIRPVPDIKAISGQIGRQVP